MRFLQDRSSERVGDRETLVADVRIIAATNRDLQAMVTTGEFRSDLYFRLRVIDVALPTLRERNAPTVDTCSPNMVVTGRLPRAPLALGAIA